MGEQKKYWEGKHFAFYTNKECEYYPCHPVPEGTEFNCLFCYCPLYMLGRKCGGNFTYLESGVKDCSECLVPHRRENYGFIALTVSRRLLARWRNGRRRKDSKRRFQPIHSEMHMEKAAQLLCAGGRFFEA